LHLEELASFREKCGSDLRVTTDVRELVNDPSVDAVFVCTPDDCHLEHATAALEAGKHVFLEKPVGITIEECDAILATAKRSVSKLYVGHNMRFYPVICPG